MTLSRKAAWLRPLAAAATGVAALLLSAGAQANSELYGWRGFYVGALGTYNIVNQDIDFTAPAAVSGSADLSGLAFTGMVGYRIPIGTERYRLGIEADGTVGDNRATFNGYRFVSDFTVSLRAVFGIHIHPDLLWFGTAGIGWMGVNSSSTAVAGGALGGGLVIADPRETTTVTGGVIGTGFEWDMGRAFHLRGEYLYGAFGSHKAESVIATKNISSDSHQLRLGIVFSLQNPYDEPHGRGDIDHDRYTRGGPMK